MSVRKILIVEDQALARTYLCSCVEKCTDCEVAGTLSRADAALRRCGERVTSIWFSWIYAPKATRTV